MGKKIFFIFTACFLAVMPARFAFSGQNRMYLYDQWGPGTGFSPAAGFDIRLDRAALIRGGYRLHIVTIDFQNLGDELDLLGHTFTTSLCSRF